MDMWTTGAGGEMPRRKAIREHRGRHVASRRCHDPTWPNGSCTCGYCSQWPATFGYPRPAPSPASRALISSLRFPCPLRAHACSSSCCCLSAARSSQHRESSNGDGVVERAEELQRRGRAEPAGAFVQVRPLRAAVLRLRYHLRPRHHVRRVVPRPAPPRPPRRLLARGLRVRPPGPRHRAGELRAVQGVRDLPLPLGHALRAWCAGAGGAGAGQLGEGAGVGGAPRRASHLPGQPGAVGQPANHPGDRVLGHRLRGAAAHHGEGPGEEEVPRRRLRPARLLQGPRQVRGAQAQGDQERAAGDAGVRGVLRAAVGVPRHRPAGEPGHAPRGPVAQQHRRHRHPQKYLRPLSGADRAREEIEELESMVFIHVSASIHWLITLPRWLCARTVRACRNCTTTSALRPATFVMCKAYEVATALL